MTMPRPVMGEPPNWNIFLEGIDRRANELRHRVMPSLHENTSQITKMREEIKSLEGQLQTAYARIAYLEGNSQTQEKQIADLRDQVGLLENNFATQVKSQNTERNQRNKEASQEKQKIEEIKRTFTAQLDLLKNGKGL